MFNVKFYLQFVKLFVRNRRRGLCHDVTAAVILREGDEVADTILAAEQSAKAVEAEGEACVRRCAVLEGVHKESELFLGLLVSEAEGLEHLLLKLAIMDTDGASTNLGAVKHYVVGVSPDIAPSLRLFEQILVFRLRRGERMVHGIITLCLLVPFEKWEIDNP